ncbi:MAG: cell division protein ZipA [Granulosicoccus sp.]
MENLRWILIFAGVAILVLLYFSGRPGKANKRSARQKNAGGKSFANGAGSNDLDVDPLLGDESLSDNYSNFNEVDPDDFIRPGARGAARDYDYEELATAPADKSDQPSSGFSSITQKIEAFSERLSPKRRQRIAESEPDEVDDAKEADPAFASKIITLHVVAQPNTVIAGDQLLDVFERRGYHFGDMNIFHSMHNGTTVFSIAKMVEPGYFDVNDMQSFETPGITLFLQLPGPVPADVSFEVLISEAFEMANELGATVLDGDRSTLSKQTLQHMREGIYEYMHRQKYFGSVPS